MILLSEIFRFTIDDNIPCKDTKSQRHFETTIGVIIVSKAETFPLNRKRNSYYLFTYNSRDVHFDTLEI